MSQFLTTLLISIVLGLCGLLCNKLGHHRFKYVFYFASSLLIFAIIVLGLIKWGYTP